MAQVHTSLCVHAGEHTHSRACVHGGDGGRPQWHALGLWHSVYVISSPLTGTQKGKGCHPISQSSKSCPWAPTQWEGAKQKNGQPLVGSLRLDPATFALEEGQGVQSGLGVLPG